MSFLSSGCFFFPPSSQFPTSQLNDGAAPAGDINLHLCRDTSFPYRRHSLLSRPSQQQRQHRQQHPAKHFQLLKLRRELTTLSASDWATRRAMICRVWDVLVATMRAFGQSVSDKVRDADGHCALVWVTTTPPTSTPKKNKKKAAKSLSATFMHPAGCHFMEISQADGSHLVEIARQLNCRWWKTFFFLSRLKLNKEKLLKKKKRVKSLRQQNTCHNCFPFVHLRSQQNDTFSVLFQCTDCD